MSPDERLARLERIMKLVIRAGVRERRDTREKINALIDSQIKLTDAQTRSEASIERLAESQTHTDERLNVLVNTVERIISERG